VNPRERRSDSQPSGARFGHLSRLLALALTLDACVYAVVIVGEIALTHRQGIESGLVTAVTLVTAPVLGIAGVVCGVLGLVLPNNDRRSSIMGLVGSVAVLLVLTVVGFLAAGGSS
jgi:hypothetical protein